MGAELPPAWVLVLDPDAPPAVRREVVATAGTLVPAVHAAAGDGWSAVALGEAAGRDDVERLARMAGVLRLVEVSSPYRLAARDVLAPGDGGVEVALPAAGGDGVRFGGRAAIGVMASSRWAMAAEARLSLIAPLLYEVGCRVLHTGRLASGADWSADALAVDALRTARDVAHENGLAISVEVTDAASIEAASELADLLQVGSRSMQDFSLLRELGRSEHPVLLRRGAGSTVEEFVLAAEYVLSQGNGRVILCESGIRTFDALRKPRFEINAVPLLRASTHLPVVADPSACAPNAASVPAIARAAVAAGADGLVLEVGTEPVHDPEGASIDIHTVRRLMADLRRIARAVGRTMGAVPGEGDQPLPRDAETILHRTDRTLGQTIEGLIGVPPDLEVVAQWKLTASASSWLSPPLSEGGRILARCTSYRLGDVRLSRNLAFVDLDRIDPTLAALLESEHLNLGQLFVDPGIEKLDFEFGNQDEAGEIDAVLRSRFADEADRPEPYVWRRYRAAIRGVVSFVVIETLPVVTWERLLEGGPALALQQGGRR